MNYNPTQGPNRLPGRSNSKEAARKKAEAAQNERNVTSAILLTFVFIGGVAAFVFYAIGNGRKSAPETVKRDEIVATQDSPAPEPVVALPTETAVVPPVETPGPLPEEPPLPPEPETAVIEEPGVVEAVVEPVVSNPTATEADLVLVGPESKRDAALNRDRDLLARAVTGRDWFGYRALLGKSIKAELAKLPLGQGLNRYDPIWNQPVLYQAFLRWKTLGCLQESRMASLVSDAYTGGMVTWLLNNDKAMEELLLTFHPRDDGGKVLKFLMDAWQYNQDDPEKYAKYFPLAVACAVVFDKPLRIPHAIGTKEYAAEKNVDPIKRYLWFIEKNEKGKLAAPVHQSSASDLVWVVCAPVTTSELEWSLDKMNLKRENWGNAYDKVNYLMKRAVEGFNPYKEYSFAEILKEGGICGDRAYFCVNTARAQGIPAMTITGETSDGPHAWVGIKNDSKEWSTTSGRIGGSSKGEIGNPQIGGTITEQDIHLWNERLHQSPVVSLAVRRLLWLADFHAAMKNDEENNAVVRLANKAGHSFTETWQALFSLLERQMQLTGDPIVPSNLAEWKSFASEMRREFKDNPRMAALAGNAEVEYIFPYGPEGDARRSLLRERRRVENNAGEQKDLIATNLKREAAVITKRGGANVQRDIAQLYDRALRDYGGSITGFKMMAEDYFNGCKGDQELAKKAARDIELAFKRVVETGTKDWFRAETEMSIYKKICGYYRVAGDPERAEMLEKRCEVLLKRAKRSAL